MQGMIVGQTQIPTEPMDNGGCRCSCHDFKTTLALNRSLGKLIIPFGFLQKLFAEERSIFTFLSTLVQETISGIRVLKSFGREAYYTQGFVDESAMYRNKQLKLVRIDALFLPVIVILVGLSTILTIYVGTYKVMNGEISPGVIVQFVFYNFMLLKYDVVFTAGHANAMHLQQFVYGFISLLRIGLIITIGEYVRWLKFTDNLLPYFRWLAIIGKQRASHVLKLLI